MAWLTVIIGTGSCGRRMGDSFPPHWLWWRLPCWVEGWRCHCCLDCCRAGLRACHSPPAAVPPAPAAVPAAAASEAAEAGRPKGPRSLFDRRLHVAHLTAETTTLQENIMVLWDYMTLTNLWNIKKALNHFELSIWIRAGWNGQKKKSLILLFKFDWSFIDIVP